MSSIETSPTAIRLPVDDIVIDDAQLAAVAAYVVVAFVAGG